VGDMCAMNADCCSNNCDMADGVCCAPGGGTGQPGDMCAMPSDCCSNMCRANMRCM
jgi:hypothetical protein